MAVYHAKGRKGRLVYVPCYENMWYSLVGQEHVGTWSHCTYTYNYHEGVYSSHSAHEYQQEHNMMYQRPSRTREAPVPIPGYPRMQCKKAFVDNILAEGYTGPCNLDCIQGFRLTWDAHFQMAMMNYCVVHDQVGIANDTLKGIFLAGHQCHELYPGGSRDCYSQVWFMRSNSELRSCYPASSVA